MLLSDLTSTALPLTVRVRGFGIEDLLGFRSELAYATSWACTSMVEPSPAVTLTSPRGFSISMEALAGICAFSACLSKSCSGRPSS